MGGEAGTIRREREQRRDPSPRGTWLQQLPIVCLVAIILLLVVHEAFYFVALGRDAVDDAYISFRYARNWVEGEGLNFNSGERVEGYTNFLWTLAMAPIIAAGLPVGPVSMVVGGMLAVATVWLIFRYAESTPAGAWSGVMAAGMLAVDGSFALWAVGGLETALFTLLVTAAAVSYLREEGHPQRGLVTGVLLALATMTRPEGLLALGAVALHSAGRAAGERRLPGSANVVRLLGFAALYAPYYLWRFSYYGYLFPNTYYLKMVTADKAAQIGRGWDHLTTFLQGHVWWLLLPTAALAFVNRGLMMAVTFLAAVPGLFAAYVVYAGGDWSVGRFFVPVLPLAYALVAFGLVRGYRGVRSGWPGGDRRALKGMAGFSFLVLALLLFLGSSLMGEYRLFVERLDAGRATQARVAMGRWLRERMPQDTYLAVDAAGQIPYFSGLRVLDMFGPTDLHIAHMVEESEPGGLAGHTKFDFDYLLEKRPDVVVVCCDPQGGFLNRDVGYELAPWVWTEDPEIAGFLTLYRRIGWTPGMSILGGAAQ